MISVEEALDRVLSYVDRLEAEERPILDALGQALAEDVRADFDIPPYDNTAMDGYAVRAEDTRGASPERPVTLRVVGELAAGYVYEGELPPGCAIRIMTGAPMPPGADAVVPFEETDEPEGHAFGKFSKTREVVGVLKEAKPGANVRRAGEDVARGRVILREGQTLRAAQIGVLASVGRTTVRVIRRPVVAILSTGDEVVEPGHPLRPGQIYDANAYSIAAMARECGAIPRQLGIARDTVEDLTAKLREGLSADMLVTSAGVSRGDYDVVKDVLAREGEVDFWTVRMKPGKPLAFGAFRAPDGRRVPHLGLPGNPVSSMVSFELFGRPAILKMMGRSDWERQRVRAIADEPIANHDGRRVFARVLVTRQDGRFHAALTGPQGSGILTSMAFANGLAVVPEDVPEIRPGDEVEVILLE